MSEQYWHLERGDGKGIRFNKTSIGNFCYEILLRGGDVKQLWVFNKEYKYSSVYAVVTLTQHMRDDLEAKCGYILTPPAQVHLN